MTSGDIGPTITISAGDYNLIGSTCKLLASPGRLNTRGLALTLTPVIVSADGKTASYTQTGHDFKHGGLWRFQLQIRTPDGQNLRSKPRKMYVFPRLGAS